VARHLQATQKPNPALTADGRWVEGGAPVVPASFKPPKPQIFGVLISLMLASCSNSADESSVTADDQFVTVVEVMESVITPATDIIWRVEDPQTDEDWKQLEDAAIVTIAAGLLIKRVNAPAMDNAGPVDPAWRELADQMIRAAAECRDAARNRDLDALLAAGEVLYPPCAECHARFHRAATD
jgi:hypothetical protein